MSTSTQPVRARLRPSAPPEAAAPTAPAGHSAPGSPGPRSSGPDRQAEQPPHGPASPPDRPDQPVWPDQPGWPGTRAVRWLRAALETSLPATCAGCGRWDTRLCPRCRGLLLADPVDVEQAQAAGDLEVMALCHYSGPVRSLVLGWKNGSREDLEGVMGAAGLRLGRAWATRHPVPPPAGPAGRPQAGPAPRPLLVVPAPSGPARRLRGRLVAARLADSVAMGITSQWTQDQGGAGTPQHRRVLSTDLLRRAGALAPRQAGRSARQRRTSRLRPPRVLAEVRDLPAILVDDVVTTGATLGACATALQEAGATVLGALVLAAAPRPTPSTTYQLWLPGPGPRCNARPEARPQDSPGPAPSASPSTCPPPAITVRVSPAGPPLIM